MFSFKIIMNREELEKKFKVFEKEIIQINEQVSVVEQATIDLEKISLGLDEIAGKKDSEILAPMGRGIFQGTMCGPSRRRVITRWQCGERDH